MANEKQLALWNGPGAAGLLAVRAELEAAIRPLGLAAIDALQLAEGERALDVGCGLGETTLELARRVGPRGAVVGIDVAEPFLALAREESRGVGNVSYLRADAQTHPFAGEFDACSSRLGLMFFDDPPAAFCNLRRALRPGGRFSAVVWGPPSACAWVELPLRAVRRALPAAPDPATSGPGPFSLSDRAALAALLSAAGFADVRVEPAALPFRCGETPAEAASFLLRFGPAAAALREAAAEGQRLRPGIESALRDALATAGGPRGVELASAQLFATATAP